jgi:poly(3-hydroxybutyrate) depolymerase
MAGGDAGISPGMSRGEAGAVPEASTPSTEGGFAHEAGGGSPGTPTTLMLGLSMMNLMVNGQSRSAALYVPAGATSTAPLVIALHGDGDIDTNFIATSGLRTLADTQAFVLLAPQGITRDVTVQGQTVPQVDWDAYNSVATGNIDLPFLEQLRAQLQGTRQVDPNKSFVFGYSQGGYMAFLYGLTDATVLSCAGVIAASSPYGGGANDPIIAGATRKIAVAMQIGTLDPAFGAAQTTQATLQADGFPLQFAAINGAGHVPIPGDISMPLNYCLGQSL